MCMYSTRQRPLVAKRDIMCVKYLRKKADGKFYTPCQNVEAPIGVPFLPVCQEIDFEKYSLTSSLSRGVIHAQTQNIDGWDDARPYKAIIPKGTEYWIDVRGYAIAAKQLIMTDEAIKLDKPDESLLKDLLENAPSMEGITVGDFYIKDHGFVSPFDMTKALKSKIDGVVVGFNDSKPLIWSGDVYTQLVMDSNYDSKFDEYTSQPEKDFAGEKHLDSFIANYGESFDKGRFQAYAICREYKPSVGKWYIPAFGELGIMVENLAFIHASAWLADTPTFMETGWYWTSSECSADGCWYICLGSYDAHGRWDYRDGRYRACFFLASTSISVKNNTKSLTSKPKKTGSALEEITKSFSKYVRRCKS